MLKLQIHRNSLASVLKSLNAGEIFLKQVNHKQRIIFTLKLPPAIRNHSLPQNTSLYNLESTQAFKKTVALIVLSK